MTSTFKKITQMLILLCCGLLLIAGCGPIEGEPTPAATEATPLDVETALEGTDVLQSVYLLGDGRTAPGWYSNGTIQLRNDERGVFRPGPDDYETGIDPHMSFNGSQSGFIHGLETESAQNGFLVQTIQAKSYRNKRVRISVYLKTEAVEQAAGAGITVFDADYRIINAYNWRSTQHQGTNDWQPSDMVLDIPEEAAHLSLYAALRGKGIVWVDDWTIEIVDATVPLSFTDTFINPGFETFIDSGPVGWFLSGSRLQNYEISQDTQYVRQGQSSVTVKAADVDETQGITLMQSLPAKPYWGQRLRLTGFVRAELVSNPAMWMRVDDFPGAVSQFDNTGLHSGGAIHGSTDWELLTIILDVPEGSSVVNLGFILAGSGQIWLDDVLLETVSDNIKTTTSTNNSGSLNLALSPFLKDPMFSSNDIGDPLNGWFATGSRMEAYEIGVDTAVYHTGGQSGYVKHIDGDGLGALAQALLAESYRGERVQVRAYVRTENTDGRARFWLQARQAYGEEPLGLATIPLDDMVDWQLQELTLDIPDSAFYIVLGISNASQGTVWIDEVTLETVDNSVLTTNWLDTADFINLDFEAALE